MALVPRQGGESGGGRPGLSEQGGYALVSCLRLGVILDEDDRMHPFTLEGTGHLDGMASNRTGDFAGGHGVIASVLVQEASLNGSWQGR